MFSVLAYLGIVVILCLWVEGELELPLHRRTPGEELEEWLKSFHWGGRSELKEKVQIPQYKFYSEVVETLLSLARRLGGNYQESLLFLRDGLQADRQFEKKLRELRLGCWLQMGFITALTWLFISAALIMVGVSFSPVKLLLIGLWQALGLFLLRPLMNHFRRKFFSDIGRLWKMLYILSSLSRVPLARSEVFALAGIPELESIKQVALRPLVERLRQACQEALKLGKGQEEELRYMMDELRFQEKWHFELFEKRLSAIKLSLLGLFFLPAYLAFTFLLLGDLMTLM